MNYQIKNDFLTAKLNQIGAELVELKTIDQNYIWEVNTEYWNRTSPILFPIVGKLKNETYKYNNKTYHLPRHGFARNLEFKVIEKTDSKIVFTTTSTPNTKEIYPFDFELQLGYILEGKTLKVTYKVINNNDFDMPFSIGGHPAFSLSNAFESYSLQFEHDEVLSNYSLVNELLTDKYEIITLNNKKLPLSYSLFEKDALIFKSLKSKSVTILDNDKPYIKVSFPDFPSLGIWTKINAPFLCIEPWFGYADHQDFEGDISNKEAILSLNKKGTFQTQYTIEIF
jgi:galactose mutarotase-like enzyme